MMAMNEMQALLECEEPVVDHQESSSKVEAVEDLTLLEMAYVGGGTGIVAFV